MGLLQRQQAELKLSQKISTQVKSELTKSQREFYLRQARRARRVQVWRVQQKWLAWQSVAKRGKAWQSVAKGG